MSKKVIEQIKVVKYFGKGEKEPTVIDNPSAIELTTVAKAICPEYQKVIDQNAKLVEALEKLHRITCYKLSPSDERDTHASFELFDEVELALQNNKKIEG